MFEHNVLGDAPGYGMITAESADSGSAAEEWKKEEDRIIIKIILVDDEDEPIKAAQPSRAGAAVDFVEIAVEVYTQPRIVISLEEEKKKLADQLLSELEMNPFEEGVHHPAEKTLEEALEKNVQATSWIYNILKDSLNNPVLAADILKCLGMIDYEKMRSIAKEIVEKILAQPGVRLRDAAVYAAEQWESGELVDILRGYAKGEKVKWLAQYMDEVADDISEE